MNRPVMLLFSCAFRIATANSSATLSTLIFGLDFFRGMVSQTTNSSSTLLAIFSYALPLNTGCVIMARTLRAPFSFKRAALLKEAKETKDKIVNDAKDEAKAQAAKIIADAQASIQQQKMAALTDLKNQIGNLVIETSEKVLRKELSNKAEQENYIKTLASEVKLN